MSEVPEISIIIRTHNEEKWIGQCLRKVEEQSVDDIEIVLVDNLSTDKTVEKAKNTYPDLTLVEIEDYWPGLALNAGIEASAGGFIVCLSAHCIPVDDNWLESLRSNFDGSGEVAGVYGRQVPVESSDPVDKRDLIRTFGPERRVQERDTFFHNANSMIRREVWKEYPFREDVTNIEDQIWGNQVINAGFKLVYEPDAAVYHHHGINQGNDESRMHGVVQTMETHEIQSSGQTADSIESTPFDPSEMDIVAFIPVRQQIRMGVDFDESLIVQTVDAAIESSYIDDAIILTDSEYVAEKAESWGAKAPFIRPAELSAADVPVIDVFRYSLTQLENDDRFPDLLVTLEITHPFRPSGLLDAMVEKLINGGFDSVIAGFPEYRPCFIRDESGDFERVNEHTDLREDRTPIQIGLLSLGCVTYPNHLREGKRTGGDVGIYEVDTPIATVEIRQRDDLVHWERLSEIGDLIR